MFKKEYSACTLCPRMCGVDRNSGKKGFCNMTAKLSVGRASLHMWEEPCISGERGSGTVFFSGCSLRCCFCQNYSLSQGEQGIEISSDELCEIFLRLQKQGAHNINLVTAEHFAPGVRDAIIAARKKGLSIPTILNSSGYVSLGTLELLRDVIDIYLVDFKYMDDNLAENYSIAPGYSQIAKNALSRMVLFSGKPEFDDEGMMRKGVIVRHLCLPDHTDDSKAVIEYVYKTYGDSVILSIMSQYTPQGSCEKFSNLCRKLKENEYENIIDFCIGMGIENAFVQEGEAASESFIPEFNGEGVVFSK